MSTGKLRISSTRDFFSNENHEKRIIQECIQKFRLQRQLRYDKLRHLDNSQLESIANNLLHEVTEGNINDGLKATSGLDDAMISSPKLSQRQQEEEQEEEVIMDYPKPIIDDTDDMYQFTGTEMHELLMMKILEALETEINLSQDSTWNQSMTIQPSDPIPSQLHLQLQSVEDCDDSYYSLDDSYVEECDKEGLICPICRLRYMELDTFCGLARCSCIEGNVINYGRIGDLQAFKQLLAAVFDRHHTQCSSQTNQLYYDDQVLGPISFSELLVFIQGEDSLQASCSRCGFHEVIY